MYDLIHIHNIEMGTESKTDAPHLQAIVIQEDYPAPLEGYRRYDGQYVDVWSCERYSS